MKYRRARLTVALLRYLLVTALAFLAVLAYAGVGTTEIAGLEGNGPVTMFYPSSATATPLERGPFKLALALNGPVVQGNGRLVVLSHGSGGSPWVHSDLAQRLVEAGFVVAVPEHDGDNWHDASKRGPASWKRRPSEVSRAIDAVAQDSRFAPLLSLDRVGMYGMSAGGHTALTLAGGRWSPSALLKHCEAHLSDDFQTCVGAATRLRGNFLDAVKIGVAMPIIRHRLDDSAWYSHEDSRVQAIVAEVPFAADFDFQSLAHPRVPLGMVVLGQDQWLAPRFHAGAVLKTCTACEVLADVPLAGHGSLLSPQPTRLGGIEGELLRDPPGFDRSIVPAAHAAIVGFFRRQLLVLK
ncbi:MAG TPA: dienelactone hydrolase [Ramlibacter sp.]|nr:dienelactone hydrolase [Ramlibacter sp.]